MICAGYEDGKKDACNHDSGGPLIVGFDEDKPSLIGVVSWGKGCGLPNYPGVYSSVTYYRKWINDKTGI